LKDSIALRVFTAENLVTLLMNNMVHEAPYFLPIVFWRVANQALTITRATRFILLEAVLIVPEDPLISMMVVVCFMIALSLN
jgi:hypothetical protein